MAVASRVQEQQQAASDARLAVGVAGGCLAALALVLLSSITGAESLPPGVDLLMVLGGVAVLLLGPVAAGLAGWASLVVLWSRGDVVPTPVRRLHLVTLLLVATYAVAFAASWSAGVWAWFGD